MYNVTQKARLADGLCVRCGSEPLVTATIGEKCRQIIAGAVVIRRPKKTEEPLIEAVTVDFKPPKVMRRGMMGRMIVEGWV